MSVFSRRGTIHLDGKTIKLSASVLGTDDVVLTGDYTLELADDVEKPTAVTASWKVNDGTAVYRTATTSGYVVDGNQVIYKSEVDDEPIMTITGLSESAVDEDISLRGCLHKRLRSK